MATPAATDPLTFLHSTARQFEKNNRSEHARIAAAGLRDTSLRQEPNSRSSSTHSLPLTESEPTTLSSRLLRSPAFELRMPEPIRKETHAYAYRSLYKELYSTLPDGHFRLLRVIPGTRRGEYTSQLLETSIECAAAEEHGYSVLQVVSDGEGEDCQRQSRQPQEQQQDHQEQHETNSARTSRDSDFWHRSTNDDTVYFPLLSLGGGEHIIEIPCKVKRALEEVVVVRWDFFHSRGWEDKEIRAWRLTGRGGGVEGEVEDRKEAEHRNLSVDVDREGDGDGDSDSGQGEDLYLWVREVCVDRRNTEDREQQQTLEDKIREIAKQVVVARIPTDMRGKVEVERMPVFGIVTSGVHEAVTKIREGISNDPRENNARGTSQDIQGKGSDLPPLKALKI